MDVSADVPSNSASDLGDDLPPVQPPSAGFIVQLFVVPALIVLAVVAVWGLFGRLAAGEQDWRTLVQDLESPNPHVYKRAMFGLAQLLDNDRRMNDAGQRLAANAEIARSLSELLGKTLDATAQDEDAVGVEVFLTRALGLLDVPNTTLPVLQRALDTRYDIEVRKGSLTSIALVSSRAVEIEAPIEEATTDAVIDLSQDASSSLRRAAAFTLGLLPLRVEGPASDRRSQRLLVLLEDSDKMTAVNAAVAFARRKSTAGYSVFLQALEKTVDANNAEAVQDWVTVQKNALRAVGDLASKWEPAQRDALRRVIAPLATTPTSERIRVDAQAALVALNSAP